MYAASMLTTDDMPLSYQSSLWYSAGGKKPAMSVEESAQRTPYNTADFNQIRIIEAWQKYATELTWGKGQCLAILDDGCDLSDPSWQIEMPWGRKVIATYNSIDEIAIATEEELAEIPGIGPKIAESIASYFQVSANQQVIAKLRAAGMNLAQEPRQVSSEGQPLAGQTFVVTGTLAGFSRTEAQTRIKDLGGKITSSVTTNTDYVVVGESPGSKLAAAERLGTQVLNEERFIEFLANPPLVASESAESGS